MQVVLALGYPGIWTSFWEHVWLFQVHVQAMLADMEPIHWGMIAIAALLLWGVMGRKR